MFGLKNEEILTCFFLIIVGYCIAKMFSRSCEGFVDAGVIDAQASIECLKDCVGTEILPGATGVPDFYGSNAQGCCDSFCQNDGYNTYMNCLHYVRPLDTPTSEE
jgi:hypothetical protein